MAGGSLTLEVETEDLLELQEAMELEKLISGTASCLCGYGHTLPLVFYPKLSLPQGGVDSQPFLVYCEGKRRQSNDKVKR